MIEFQYKHPDEGTETDEKAENPATAEHIHRVTRRSIKKLHHKQIKQHLYSSLKSIFGAASPARMMINDELPYFRSMPGSVDGQEPVHFAVKPDTLYHMPFVGFQRTTKIMKPNT